VVDDTTTSSLSDDVFLADEPRVQEICAQLESISEALGDVSFDLLREAVEKGASKRPAADKKLAQARRAVDKAARLLSS